MCNPSSRNSSGRGFPCASSIGVATSTNVTSFCVCAQAASLDPTFAPGFFYYGFDWVKVGEGKAFATGYYEPEIEGSRTPQPGYVRTLNEYDCQQRRMRWKSVAAYSRFGAQLLKKDNASADLTANGDDEPQS